MRSASVITGELIASGLSQPQMTLLMELVLFMSSGSAPKQAEEIGTLEKRRAWDRERKRLQRGLRLPESEWFPLVCEILERDGHKCTYCVSTEGLTADHVIPLTRGGSNDPSNLTACCIPCNTKKSNKLVSEWLPASSTVFHPNVHHNLPDEETASLSVKTNLDKNKKKRGELRGTRLPPDFIASAEDRDFAKQLGWSDAQINSEAANFRDYWIAKPGSGGLKLDWPATWRKWIRSSKVHRSDTSAKPLTEFQRKQQATNDVTQKLRDAAVAARGGGEADRFLSHDHGERPGDLRGGPGAHVLALSRASGSRGG